MRYLPGRSILLITLVCLASPLASASPGPWADAIKVSESLSKAPLIERKTFLNLSRRERISGVVLSPDGHSVLHIATAGKISSVWLTDTGTLEKKHLFIARELRHVDWSIDSKNLLLELDEGIARFTLGKDSAPVLLFRKEPGKSALYHGPDSISPGHFFVSQKNLDGERILYRGDLTGDKREKFRTPGKRIRGFLTDGDGNLTFVKLATENHRIIYRIEQGQMVEILRCEFDDDCRLIKFDKTRNKLILMARLGGNFSRLLAYDPENKRVEEIHRDPEETADIRTVRSDPESDQLLVASYEGDYTENYGLSPESKRHIAVIKMHFGDPVSLQISPRTGVKPWLITENAMSRQQDHYFLYDPATENIVRLFAGSEEDEYLTEDTMAPIVPVHYQASDGRPLHGYLTLPRGVDLQNSPLVVFPHGGPWLRIFGRFDMISQFLANRGYIVFQPNFRSSTGYGLDYVMSANRDWGDGRVQQDMIDGLQYLLAAGIGGPDRLAIYGQSFGGFATLGALAYTPALFQVGIATAPPADLGKAMKRILAEGRYFRDDILGPKQILTLVGNIDDEGEMQRLYRNSPARHADKITKPLLIMAGAKDIRINIDDVKDYALGLEAMGKQVSFLIARREGHSFRQPLARQAYLYLLEKMLAQNIGGRYQPAADPKLITYLRKNIRLDTNKLLP